MEPQKKWTFGNKMLIYIIDFKISENSLISHPVGSIKVKEVVSEKMEEKAKSKVIDNIPLSKTRKRSRLQMLADHKESVIDQAGLIQTPPAL